MEMVLIFTIVGITIMLFLAMDVSMDIKPVTFLIAKAEIPL